MTNHEKPWYFSAIVKFLLDDVSQLMGLRPSDFLRDVKTLEDRIACEGESFLTKTLPALGKVFDLALQERCPLTHRSFKSERPGVRRPAFLQAIFRRIFDEDGNVGKHPDVTAIRLSRQILFWCKKVEKGYSDESYQRAIEDYIKVDESLPTPETELNSSVLDVARALMSHVLGCRIYPNSLQPRHGPGAVAGGEGTVSKRSLKTCFTNLERAFRPIPFFFSLRDAAEAPWRVYGRFRQEYGISRTEFVEKDSSGPRTIGLEPAEYMWCQQALKGFLYDHVENHPLTKGHVNFTDQSINRDFTANWVDFDTLDMSKASDRNSYALVKSLMGHLPIWRYLDASRSPVTKLPDGRLLKLRKFAPMGSAVCFPVEALVFWALTCSVLHLYAGYPINLVHRFVYVYGDDLIVPHGFYPLLSREFEKLGLVFNEDKSCTSGKFRESCGLDAYDGNDVTPVRLKKVEYVDGDDLTVIPLVKHSNALIERGYWAAGRELRHAAYRAFPKIGKFRIPVYGNTHLPILYWRDVFTPCCRVEFRNSIPYVKGLFLRPFKVKGHPADERCYLRESLSHGGPVGAFMHLRGKIVRTFQIRFRGSLRVKRVPYWSEARDGLPMDHRLNLRQQ